MPNRAAAKGNRFEAIVCEYLRSEIGPHLTRPRPGAEHDRGDVAGIPHWTLEIKNWRDTLGAINAGLTELDREQAFAGTLYGAVIVKRPRITAPGRQLAVMTLEAAAALMHDSIRWYR